MDFTRYFSFKELHNLEVLDLSHNKQCFFEACLDQNLLFIVNIPEVKILHLNLNEISLSVISELRSSFLQKSGFQENDLVMVCRNGHRYYIGWFKHLRYLRHLNFSYNGLLCNPLAAFENLPSCLWGQCLNNNRVHTLIWEQLRYFKSMKLLESSQNQLQIAIQLKATIQLHTAASH